MHGDTCTPCLQAVLLVPIRRVTVHHLFTLRRGVHVTMGARLVAVQAYVGLFQGLVQGMAGVVRTMRSEHRRAWTGTDTGTGYGLWVHVRRLLRGCGRVYT